MGTNERNAIAAAVAADVTNTAEKAAQTIDGFHLVIEALKLNGLNTIYGLPGIPITDLTRMAQAEEIGRAHV